MNKLAKNIGTLGESAVAGMILFACLFTRAPSLAAKDEWPAPIKDDQIFSFLLFDQLEYRNNEGPDTFSWDVQGWVGGDYNRLWVKTEGDIDGLHDTGGELEVQALYSRLISPFWDFQAGIRYDWQFSQENNQSRGFAVFGFEGIAPYQFDIEPALFISEEGHFSARITAEYDLRLTQRLILQPRFEANAAAHDAKAFGVGSGLNDVELALRLRYEIRREFAPYAGISWERKLANSADIAQSENEEISNFAFVVGMRVWF